MNQKPETGQKEALHEGSSSDRGEGASGAGVSCCKRRLLAMAAYCVVLTLALGLPLLRLVSYVMDTELHSHVVLIPVVTGWLLWTDWAIFQARLRTSLIGVMLFAVPGVLGVVTAMGQGPWASALSENDQHSLWAASYLCLLVSGAFGFLGGAWMKKAIFPVFFLIFMIPLPDNVVVGVENALMVASAEAADWLFSISGTPVFRVGQDFHLPGFSLEVAQECSGIRSSWVLLITSFIGAYLFLRSNWRRALFVAVVIPLGIVRNGFRVLVIGMLCVHEGPHMIDSWIHHKGGPLFFGLSLGPLFLFLWWLKRGESAAGHDSPGDKPLESADPAQP